MFQFGVPSVQRKIVEYGWKRLKQKKLKIETGSDTKNWNIFWLTDAILSIKI